MRDKFETIDSFYKEIEQRAQATKEIIETVEFEGIEHLVHAGSNAGWKPPDALKKQMEAQAEQARAGSGKFIKDVLAKLLEQNIREKK